MKPKPELFIRDLGDGLILRHASAGDADALAEINSRMHSDDGPDKPNLRIGAWTRDLVAILSMKPWPIDSRRRSSRMRIMSACRICPLS